MSAKLRRMRRSRGTEAFWVPAVLAAVSGGAQYANQQQANSRAQSEQASAIQNQQQIQQDALANVNKLTQQIAQDTPAQIQNQATGDYVANLRRNEAGAQQSGTSSALAPVVGGSARYNSGKAASQATVNDFGNTEAAQMGAIDAAPRQRQNEGLAQGSLQTALGGLGAQSATQGWVDQLRAAAAGQSNPWVSLGSTVLGNAANYLSKNYVPQSSVVDPNTGAVMTTPGGYSFLNG